MKGCLQVKNYKHGDGAKLLKLYQTNLT